MKIAHIHNSLGTGGIEAVICNVANEMAKMHDVTICTIRAPLPSPDDKFHYNLSPKIHRETIGRTDKKGGHCGV